MGRPVCVHNKPFFLLQMVSSKHIVSDFIVSKHIVSKHFVSTNIRYEIAKLFGNLSKSTSLLLISFLFTEDTLKTEKDLELVSGSNCPYNFFNKIFLL